MVTSLPCFTLINLGFSNYLIIKKKGRPIICMSQLLGSQLSISQFQPMLDSQLIMWYYARHKKKCQLILLEVYEMSVYSATVHKIIMQGYNFATAGKKKKKYTLLCQIFYGKVFLTYYKGQCAFFYWIHRIKQANSHINKMYHKFCERVHLWFILQQLLLGGS